MKQLKVYSASRNGLQAPRSGDVGYDITALETVALEPYSQSTKPVAKIRTGVHIELPIGYAGFLVEKSSVSSGNDKLLGGLALRSGLIDPSYRGEIIVCIQNISNETQIIEAGQKIAQLVIIPYITPDICFVSQADLSSSDRGNDGFGSTGTHND